jgi:chemotaxis protein CheY-P-specific phosphatase CheC
MSPTAKAEDEERGGGSSQLPLDIVEAGAGEAALAVARLLKATGFSVEAVEIIDGDALAARHGPRALIVSFSVSGALGGGFALVTSEEHARALAVQLVGGGEGGLPLTRKQLGALTELGNIGASAYLNSIANRLGARCLPSVPSLILDDAPRAVESSLGDAASIQVARVLFGAHAVDLALVAD